MNNLPQIEKNSNSLSDLRPQQGGSLRQEDLPRKTTEIPKSSALNIENSLFHGLEIWSNLKADILQRDLTPKYPIGLTDLDDVLWGLHKKELFVIGARTSHGKSCMAIHLTRKLCELSQSVIYFSLEMSKEQILERLLCNICRLNNLALRSGQSKELVINKENEFTGWLKHAELLIDDRFAYDFNNLVKICDLMQPDFIILDYIQMVSTRGYRSKVEAIEEYVRKLKELSIIKNFGVILISQMNRAGTEEPSMNNLKWAGVLEEHADTVITLQWKYDQDLFEVHIEKQRHGDVKDIKLKFVPAYSAFENYIPPAPPKDKIIKQDRYES